VDVAVEQVAHTLIADRHDLTVAMRISPTAHRLELPPAAGPRTRSAERWDDSRVAVVRIGASDQALQLIVEGDEESPPEYLWAELRSGDLRAAKRIYGGHAPGFQDLAAFFAGIVATWRGWEGERSWESVEGDLRIAARHAHGHIQLRVTLRAEGPGWGNDGWTATADLTLDPGEQLTIVADSLASVTTGAA
jgi:Family of unknown function (DUF6228)